MKVRSDIQVFEEERIADEIVQAGNDVPIIICPQVIFLRLQNEVIRNFFVIDSRNSTLDNDLLRQAHLLPQQVDKKRAVSISPAILRSRTDDQLVLIPILAS